MVTVKSFEKEGFFPVFQNSAFKCAFITHSDQYSHGKILQMKQHNDSDEVFVLLQGSAVLLTRESATSLCLQTTLEKNKAYNVHQGVFHYLAVSEDALLFVAESGSMEPKNTVAIDVSAESLYI